MWWASTGKKTKEAQVKGSQMKGWNRNKGFLFFSIFYFYLFLLATFSNLTDCAVLNKQNKGVTEL